LRQFGVFNEHEAIVGSNPQSGRACGSVRKRSFPQQSLRSFSLSASAIVHSLNERPTQGPVRGC
jgi:hypothetical protein